MVVHHGPDFVELVVGAVKMVKRAVIGVVLGGDGPVVIQIVGDPFRGNEFQATKTTAATLTAESADTGRIAVARTDGSVAVYSTSGALLRTVTPGSVREIALQGDALAVLTKTKTLELYSAHTGASIGTWPVPGGAANAGCARGPFGVAGHFYIGQRRAWL